MEAVSLLEQAKAAGLTVRAEGDLLAVRGPRRLEPLALELLNRKSEILPLLRPSAVLLSLDDPLLDTKYKTLPPHRQALADFALRQHCPRFTGPPQIASGPVPWHSFIVAADDGDIHMALAVIGLWP